MVATTNILVSAQATLPATNEDPNGNGIGNGRKKVFIGVKVFYVSHVKQAPYCHHHDTYGAAKIAPINSWNVFSWSNLTVSLSNQPVGQQGKMDLR